MTNILIDRLRISNFRGLEDFKINLSKTTVLTGVNNAGKTTVLKALQLALGNRAFITTDDLYIKQAIRADKIIIDIRIIPVDEKGKRIQLFDEIWESTFKEIAIMFETDGNAYFPLRTVLEYNAFKGDFDKTQSVLKEWESNDIEWKKLESSRLKLSTESLPFYYIEAQRDVVEDMRLRTSFLGKMLSQVSKSYSSNDIEALEELIKNINEEAINRSDILTIIQVALSGVDATIDNKGSNIAITPFAKKIRDLNKNITIEYGEKDDAFMMDYHGMGTRSWSSLLTFKAFLNQIQISAEKTEDTPYFPIIAIEEPEAHLHPNAQKKLYHQINEMPGQKIISTHSPYVAACAELSEIRDLYKNKKDGKVYVGALDCEIISPNDLRKIRQKVINTKGEILFSKALVLFEGETEEQAFPIMAEKYFRCSASELGIDFVGVGGAGQYYPFIKLAADLNIPWYIFSDGEDMPVSQMTSAVKDNKGSSFTNIKNENNIFIIDNKEDFEKYIIRLDYLLDIKNVIKAEELPKCLNIRHKNKKADEIDKFTSEHILVESKIHKTQYALIYANAICHSVKPLPPLVTSLFDKIKIDLGYE